MPQGGKVVIIIYPIKPLKTYAQVTKQKQQQVLSMHRQQTLFRCCVAYCAFKLKTTKSTA